MTELEAYLSGVVFEEQPQEDETEEDDEIGGVGEYGDSPEEDDEDEDDGEEDDEEEEEEEDPEQAKQKSKRGQAALKQIKDITKDIEPIKIQLTTMATKFKGSSGALPPMMWPSDIKTIIKAGKILKTQESDLNKMRKSIDKKNTNLITQFTKEKTKLQTEQPIIVSKLADVWASYWGAWAAFWNVTVVPNIQWFALVFGVLAIVCLVVLLIFASVGSAQQAGGLESLYGANGKDFYGVRLIYKDEAKEKEEIINNFISVLRGSINHVESAWKAEDGSLELDIYLELPENVTATELILESEGVYKEEYEVVTEMALAVNSADGGAGGESLIEIVDGIQYFGIAGAELNTEVAEVIIEYINSNDSYNYTGEDDIDSELEIDNGIRNYINQTCVTRTEKLFVEDHMFESESDQLKVTAMRNYVAMIYLTKQNISVNHLWMRAIQEDLTISMKLFNAGTEIALNPEGADFGKPETGEGEDFEDEDFGGGDGEEEFPSDEEVGDSQTYVFATASEMGLIVNAGSEVDIENPIENKALSNVGSTLNGNMFLQLVEGTENVYTYNKNGFMVTFDANKPFYFSEIELAREIVRE